MIYEKAISILNELKRIPYPEITYIETNKTYANMLYNDYAGEESELTATMQYIFQHLNIIEYSDISKTLSLIAKDEMLHFELLGKLIKKLGGVPYCIGNNTRPWTSNNIRYDTNDIESVIKYNIASEKNAIENYRKAMMYTSSRVIRNLLERIILDEKAHIQIFENILYTIKTKTA